MANLVSLTGLIIYKNEINENTPIRGGVYSFLDFYSLFGGYKILRSKFIPVYQICTPPDRLDCGCEAEN